MVCRGQIFGLADHCHADVAHLLEKRFLAQIHTKAGNALQLVQRAAGVAQSAPAHFGYGHTAGGYQRGQDERGGITHAAGGMLVHRKAGDGGQVAQIARMRHGKGELHRLLTVHAVETNGHQQGGQLIVRDAAICRSPHKPLDFLPGQRLGQLLFFDDFHHVHGCPSFCIKKSASGPPVLRRPRMHANVIG